MDLKRLIWVIALAACSDAPIDDRDTTNGDLVEVVQPLAGNTVRMDFARPTFFAAPFPSVDLFDDGARVAAWPNPDPGGFVGTLVTFAQRERGASLAGGIFFSLSEPLDPAMVATLPTAATTEGPIRLHAIDGSVLGPSLPVTIHYEDDGGPYGAGNMLSALPVQGIPLAPSTQYVAYIERGALGLGRDQALSDLLAERSAGGLDDDDRDAYRDAMGALQSIVARDDIVGLTTFRTGDPASEMNVFTSAALAEPNPALDDLELLETYEGYCVYGKTVSIPDYQRGEPPFSGDGEGVWELGPGNAPQRFAPTRVFVTVPRQVAPATGYPTLVFIRTGGGGERPLIDRGVRAVAHGEPIIPKGSGPAVNLAAAGWAAITWDGPHGGPRNPTGADEQFLVFNVLNPGATRDNVRQSALEAVVVKSWLPDLHIDASGCAGASTSARFDDTRTAIMGHSMGGWIAPIAMHLTDFDAAVLSGAGGSWIENVVHKLSPLAVRPVAESILGYDTIGRSLGAHDPTLTLLQWVGEAADPQIYRHNHAAILMIEGIVDTYILPPIANATALSQGLDLAGTQHDATDPRLAEFVPLGELLPFVGGSVIALPASGNDGGRTRVVVQSPGDAIEDGHEAMFQTVAPKVQYRCFLADLAADRVPTVRAVPANATELGPCDP